MTSFALKLADHHDADALAKAYAQDNMVQVKNLFPDEVANQIAEVLARQTPWRTVHSDASGDHIYYRPEAWQKTTPQEKQQIVRGVMEQAKDGFAYLYSCYPMIDAFLAGDDPNWPLHAMTEFLNTNEFKTFVKRITNEPTVKKLDGQATLYGRGNFLNTHNDTGTKAERRAAYVMGFSRDWRVDWGGQLLFLGDDGQVTRGFNPSFNSLTLFKVPRMHIVTQVTNFAPRGRYSITGWLRDDG